jgi:hypothetical protein
MNLTANVDSGIGNQTYAGSGINDLPDAGGNTGNRLSSSKEGKQSAKTEEEMSRNISTSLVICLQLHQCHPEDMRPVRKKRDLQTLWPGRRSTGPHTSC